MECWSVQHQILAVGMFIKTESVTATQCGFYQQFQRLDAPCCISLLLWYQNGVKKESKPQGCPFSAPTPDNLKRVESPCCKVRAGQLSGKLSHFTSTNAALAKFFSLDLLHHPYRIKVAQELGELDKVSRLQFCDLFLYLVKNKSNIMNTLLMSDEANFHVSGYVNKQNCRYWAPNNPHELHQCPLHCEKVTVWCAVYSHGIFGPYFCENAEGCAVTDTEWYKVMLETFLCIELHPCQQDLLWFQQDGATAHTAQISMQVIRTVFPGRHISLYGEIIWPACSPDHAVPDCFLWGYIKSKVYEKHPANIADLKQ